MPTRMPAAKSSSTKQSVNIISDLTAEEQTRQFKGGQEGKEGRLGGCLCACLPLVWTTLLFSILSGNLSEGILTSGMGMYGSIPTRIRSNVMSSWTGGWRRWKECGRELCCRQWQRVEIKWQRTLHYARTILCLLQWLRAYLPGSKFPQ